MLLAVASIAVNRDHGSRVAGVKFALGGTAIFAVTAHGIAAAFVSFPIALASVCFGLSLVASSIAAVPSSVFLFRVLHWNQKEKNKPHQGRRKRDDDYGGLDDIQFSHVVVASFVLLPFKYFVMLCFSFAVVDFLHKAGRVDDSDVDGRHDTWFYILVLISGICCLLSISAYSICLAAKKVDENWKLRRPAPPALPTTGMAPYAATYGADAPYFATYGADDEFSDSDDE